MDTTTLVCFKNTDVDTRFGSHNIHYVNQFIRKPPTSLVPFVAALNYRPPIAESARYDDAGPVKGQEWKMERVVHSTAGPGMTAVNLIPAERGVLMGRLSNPRALHTVLLARTSRIAAVGNSGLLGLNASWSPTTPARPPFWGIRIRSSQCPSPEFTVCSRRNLCVLRDGSSL